MHALAPGYGLEDVRPLLARYLEILEEEFGSRLVSVAVFGSVARGEAREGSDVDLLIVVEGLPEDVGSRLEEISRARWRLRLSSEYEDAKRRGAPRRTSEILLTPEEVKRHPPILLDMTEDAVILYDRGGFLARELE
ncbi:MAG: nucleotidyltransferase domain-containing protein, partial [Thermoproteales archaeon]|nr:nucleotidyltransferase domain-containing protein [Thermoproteales archaeon]